MGTLYVLELFLPFNFGATPKRSVILIHKTSQDQFQKQNNFKDNKIKKKLEIHIYESTLFQGIKNPSF